MRGCFLLVCDVLYLTVSDTREFRPPNSAAAERGDDGGKGTEPKPVTAASLPQLAEALHYLPSHAKKKQKQKRSIIVSRYC